MGRSSHGFKVSDGVALSGGFDPNRGSTLPLSRIVQLFIGAGSLLILGVSLVSTTEAWIGAVAVLSLFLSFRVATNPFYSLLTFLAVMFAVVLQPQRENGVSAIDVIAGVVMLGLFLWWFLRDRATLDRSFSLNWGHLLLLIYFVWSIVIGIAGMIAYNNSPNDWLREILIQLPLVFIPYIVVQALEGKEKREKILFQILPVVWMVIMIIAVIQFRSHLLKAVYFYQTGRIIFGLTSAILLFFSSVSFVIVEENSKRIKYFAFAGALAAVLIGLSMYRTVWIACLVALPVVYALASKGERKRLRKYTFILSLLLLSGLTVAYIRVPLVRIFVASFFSRFASTTQVTTDASLVNRYIEWRELWNTIKGSPLVGYGYGARYLDFDWLRGYWIWAGYSHNAYLFVLFKSGILGFTALFAAYLGFVIKALKLARSKLLDPVALAAVRVAMLWSIFLLITSLTLNAFAEREAMFWLGLSWGLLTFYERRAGREKDAMLPRNAPVVEPSFLTP